MAYTKRLDARVKDLGTGIGSGDFTSGAFTTVAGSLLCAIVTVNQQNAATALNAATCPNPTTTGTTWGAPIRIADADAVFEPIVLVYFADSPGDHADRTFAMAGSSNWDTHVNCVDLCIIEFDGGLAKASQTGGFSTLSSNSGSARDPGTGGVGALSATPDTSSYVVAVFAGDGNPSAGTPGTGWTELTDRPAVTGGPFLQTQIQIITGKTDTAIAWVDVSTSGAQVFSYAAVAIEIEMNAGPTVPGAISDLAGTPADASVVLDWTAPSDGGSAITDYTVQFREA